MSASDAAPLPRLGEVFFDVRGSSRSMRLSWYADTGVAVFSIWQGGMCTGTFRLAMGDLPRMVETLERGPGGDEPGPEPSATEAFGDAGADDATRAQGLDPLSADELPDYRPGPPGYGPGSSPEQYPEQPDYRAAAAEYLAERPDPLAGSGQYPTQAPDYPAESPDPWNGPADHAADSGRNGHPGAAGLPGYGDPPPPAPHADPLQAPYTDRRSGSSYPGRPPEAPFPGAGAGADARGAYPGAHYPGGLSGSPYPGPRSDAPFPGAGADVSGPYPGPSDGPYPGPHPGGPFPGAGAGADARGAYPGEPDPFSHPAAQPPDAGAGGPHPRGGAGRRAADYPAHYGAADGDDLPPSPPPESFPYGQPPGNRGAGGRHADPDTPFD